jgi:tripartite-type tricarboxylate transporter receptor subunit TctC
MQFIKKSLLVLAISTSSMLANALEFTVHHAPGGPSDRVTRLITKYLPSEYVVVNRPGAGGRIAVKHLIKDNTIMLATVSQIFVTNLLSVQGAGYDSIRDLEIVGTAAVMPNVLACRSSLAVKDVKDLNGRLLNFGVAGYGSSEHIATEALFTKLTGNYQSVPYAQGGATGVNDLLAGNLDCMFANYPTIKPFLEDPRITVLFSSHDLGLNVSTWREQFREQFPFQSYLSIIVSKNI